METNGYRLLLPEGTLEISLCSYGRSFINSYLWLGKEPCGIESEKGCL